MAYSIRRLLKNIVPTWAVRRIRTQRALSIVKKSIAQAPDSPEWLDKSMLRQLMEDYDFPEAYGYDRERLEIRGKERAAEILDLPEGNKFKTTLEFGCGDAMVSATLAKRNLRAIASDISNVRLDQRALAAGVDFRHGDAAGIDIESNIVDCVFSYNAFEHVHDPPAVLREMARITKPGGTIFLSFGPLYWSAFGEHAYRSIPIPFCQCLFPLSILNDFCREHAYDEIDPMHVNQWSLTQYRKLWSAISPQLKCISYRENPSVNHINLIQKFPSCFKNKALSPLDYIIGDIRIILRKKRVA
ncbi:MAG: hypothetical protein CMJ74_02015 [Planctomycetaceae bacterium]|nr:hypothetical protein [Planctomycetaceae bacterium]|tara:strand:- start:6076 stop:6978 length:903 start_codon:yes stop_codon:yes gene_type:complete